MKRILAPLFVALRASAELDVKKNRPVSKVIVLLKEMRDQLEKEHDEDQKIFDKLQCWCSANRKGKSQAIKDAESRVEKTQALIEQGKGKMGQFRAEIKNLQAELVENNTSLDTATKLRKEKLDVFNKQEKDLLQSIESLDSAVVVLGRHNKTKAMLQEKDMANIKQVINMQMSLHRDILDTSLEPSAQRFLSSLMDVSQSPSYSDYSNQSGEIFGILRDMLDTFKSNLTEARETEKTDAASFVELKAAKLDEIRAGTEMLEQKQQHFADVQEAVANGKESIASERASIDADTKFLLNVDSKCKETDFEWAARQKTRSEEIQAVGQALKILDNDDSHDLFTKTFNSSFVQLRKIHLHKDNRRIAAAKLLRQNPRLSAIASHVELDAFTKVKKMIDDMVGVLKKEKKEEEKQRDVCIKDLHETEVESTKETRIHEDAQAKMDSLESTIDGLKTEMKGLKDTIKEDEKQIKTAGEDRDAANAEFKATEVDQNQTIQLIEKAAAVLKKFYHDKKISANRSTVENNPDYTSVLLKEPTSFVQLSQEPAESEEKETVVGKAAPQTFDNFQKNQGGNSVIALLMQITSEAKAMLVEARRDEAEAQKMYESTTADLNNGIDKKNREIVMKTEEQSTAEQDHTAATKEHADAGVQLKALQEKNAALHQSCDFMINNFDQRQAAFDDEVTALQQAKAILSGSDFSLPAAEE